MKTLIHALNDEDKHVRMEVINALGKINDPRAVKPLINILKDKEKDKRIAALIALEVLETKRPKALKDKILEYAREVVRGHKERGYESNKFIVEGYIRLLDGGFDDKTKAATALGRIPDKILIGEGNSQAIEALICPERDLI